MRIGYMLLLGFLAYVAWKYYNAQIIISKRVRNVQGAPPGVNRYCETASPSRPQQVWAFQRNNSCSSTQLGYSPAFGPRENNPDSVFSLEI